MSRQTLTLSHITFAHPGGPAIFQDFSAAFAHGWTGVMGPNGVGKSTLLALALGLLSPQEGQVLGPEPKTLCNQEVAMPPVGLEELFASNDHQAKRWIGLMQLDPAWVHRWPSLSPGERKRLQLACALWREPALLALDEPSNHLDASAKSLLIKSLSGFNGIGLLISHDRELLQGLCRQVLLLQPGQPCIKAPGWQEAFALQAAQAEFSRQQQEQFRQRLHKLEGRAALHRQEASLAHQKRSKKGIPKKDHDAKGKLDLARVSGKDGQAGRRLNQLVGRIGKLQEEASRICLRPDYLGAVQLQGRVSQRDCLLDISPGELWLGPEQRLQHEGMQIFPQSRIGIQGANGVGKTSLLQCLAQRVSLKAEAWFYLPQEFTPREAHRLWQDSKTLQPQLRGQVLALVGRLGSDPKALLQSAAPSPGELRKLALARALLQGVSLLLLDEPTNHLDLPGIRALEAALAEYQAALVLISHDAVFLASQTAQLWKIETLAPGLRRQYQLPEHFAQHRAKNRLS